MALGDRREPAWHTLVPARPDGQGGELPPVRWQLRFLPGEVYLAVQARVSEQMAQIRLGVKSLADIGYDDADFGLLGEPEILVGVGQLVGAAAYAKAALVDWTGMAPPGEPEPDCNDEANIVAALRHGLDGDGPVLLSAVFAISNGDRSRIVREGEP